MDAHPRIYLSDTMTSWPWPRAINPHFEDVKAEVDASFYEFKALSPKTREAYDRCDPARLVARAYPNAPREHLRIGCDLMNLFLVVDEHTDSENGAVTKEMVDIVLDALHNPHKIRPEGECILGEIARQFWARAIQTARLPSQRRFLETFTAYLHAVVAEALDREQDHRRSIDDYLKLRRGTIGAKPCFPIFEMGMDIPDEVFYDPVVVELAECSTELILIDNDMMSYTKNKRLGPKTTT